MKIVVATPLYPPDVDEQALYVKELVRRLAANHQVSVVAYGKLLEEVPGIRSYPVNKRLPTLIRLLSYTFALVRAAGTADLIYAQNGPSVELPASVVTRVLKKPMVLGITDVRAHERSLSEGRLQRIEQFARSVARSVITEFPLPRPEILPFSDAPVDMTAYEASWEKHLSLLETTFRHA